MSLWMVRGGKGGEHEDVSLENSLAGIGYGDVADLSKAKTKEAIGGVVREGWTGASEPQVSNAAAQLNIFANRMKKGDLVALPRKRAGQIALGKVTGGYKYRSGLGDVHHTREVEWLKTDIPRSAFGQDLLYSLGAFLTVCQIERNDAENRVRAILSGKTDPGFLGEERSDEEPTADQLPTDVEQLALDQVRGLIEQRFKGHDFSRLVEAILQAEGYVTHLSPPGPDGGVDIMARRGALGLEGEKLCVQVKSSAAPADVVILRGLLGTMSTFNAEQGLLVSWGGLNKVAEREARQSFFDVRVWNSDDLMDALFRAYERLPEELQTELPLKRIWALVPEEVTA